MPAMKKHSFEHDYKVHKLIGKDSHAEVYHCVNKATKIDRAVKVYKKRDICRSEESKKRFMTEIEIYRQLDHPNVIKLFEIYADDSKFYLVEELITGGELFNTVVRYRCIQERYLARIARDLLSGLAYCHERGIIHRNLKP